MVFLTDNDFSGIIDAGTLGQLRGANDVNLSTAEKLAISELDPLRNNFDVDGELAKSGDARNDMLVRVVVHITTYYLYNTVQDVDIPERIDTNYSNQLKTIEKVATGRMSSTLDPVLNADSKPKSNYRFGSDTPRDNNIF